MSRPSVFHAAALSPLQWPGIAAVLHALTEQAFSDAFFIEEAFRDIFSVLPHLFPYSLILSPRLHSDHWGFIFLLMCIPIGFSLVMSDERVNE